MQLAGRHRRHRPSARIWPRGPLSRRRCSGLAAPRSRRPRRLERFKRHLNGTYAYFEDRDGRGNLLAVLPLSPVPCGAVDNHAACGGRLLAVQTLRRARAQNPQDQQVQDRLLPYRRAATRPVIPQDLDREQSARRSRRSSARRHLQPERRPSHWPNTGRLAVYEDMPYELPAKKMLYGPPSKEKGEKAKLPSTGASPCSRRRQTCCSKRCTLPQGRHPRQNLWRWSRELHGRRRGDRRSRGGALS